MNRSSLTRAARAARALPLAAHPAVDYLGVRLRARVERARSAETSRGASAVEWIVISAIVVLIVIAVGAVIKKALSDKADSISHDISDAGK